MLQPRKHTLENTSSLVLPRRTGIPNSARNKTLRNFHSKNQQNVNVAKNDGKVERTIVAVRMRKMNERESINNNKSWVILPKYSSISQCNTAGQPLSDRINGKSYFTYDKIFGEDVSTEEVYRSVGKGIVSSVLHGVNGTIFAYGQTSSGKTYTMQGSGSIKEGCSSGGGIVHMAAKDIFDGIQEMEDRGFSVRVSFLEIYNEEVRDLLSDDHEVLQIREDPKLGVFVQSQEEIASDFDGLLELLYKGDSARTYAVTAMNERSSRSHTIFRITIESRMKKSANKKVTSKENNDPTTRVDDAVRTSTLNLVDLAGSESVRLTGSTGERQKEGGMINASLLTLSRVIVALGTPNKPHVNFRDSKLTRILQPSLSGNARMTVICCVTPSGLYQEETRSTLQFASRAKLVKTKAQVNEAVDHQSQIRHLERELRLRDVRQKNMTLASEQRLRALEQKARKAEVASKAAENKYRRLKDLVLSSDILFHGKRKLHKSGYESDLDDQRKRRRYSYCEHSIGASPRTPKKNSRKNSCPQSLPHSLKMGNSNKNRYIPPLAELELLRQALSKKSSSFPEIEDRAQHVDGRDRIKKRLDFEHNIKKAGVASQAEKNKFQPLKDLVPNGDILFRGKRKLSKSGYESASNGESCYSVIRKKRRVSYCERTTGISAGTPKEKDTNISCPQSLPRSLKIGNSSDGRYISPLAELELLRQALSKKASKDGLQKRFGDLQKERIRSAFQLAQVRSDKESLSIEHEESKKLLHELTCKVEQQSNKIRSLEAELNKSEKCKRSLDYLESLAKNKEYAAKICELEIELKHANQKSRNSVLKKKAVLEGESPIQKPYPAFCNEEPFKSLQFEQNGEELKDQGVDFQSKPNQSDEEQTSLSISSRRNSDLSGMSLNDLQLQNGTLQAKLLSAERDRLSVIQFISSLEEILEEKSKEMDLLRENFRAETAKMDAGQAQVEAISEKYGEAKASMSSLTCQLEKEQIRSCKLESSLEKLKNEKSTLEEELTLLKIEREGFFRVWGSD